MAIKVSPSPLFAALSAAFAAACAVRAGSREFKAQMRYAAGLIGTASADEAAAICQSLRTAPAGIGRAERSAVIRGLAAAGERIAAELPQSVTGAFYRVTFASVAGSLAVNVVSETREQTEQRVRERDEAEQAERNASLHNKLAAQIAALDAETLAGFGLVAKSA